MLKKSTLTLLTLGALNAYASDYLVLVPVGARNAATSVTVSLATAAPQMAIVGRPYSYNLANLLMVTGDRGFTGTGVSWRVVSSTLPAGLYLTNDGYIGGTPTAAGDGRITVRATYKKASGEQTYQVVTLNISVNLAAATPPQAKVGLAYSYNLKPLLSVSGDNAYNGSGVTWSAVADTLPAGLYLTADGYIGGTPTAAGSGSITARATYKGVNGQQTYQVVTLNISVTLAAATPPRAIVGQAYSYDLKPLLSVSGDNAYNGSGVTWSAVADTLPAGLYLTADGYIGGTPTAAGSGSITARATYKGVNGQQTYQVVTLNISVTLAAATPPRAIVGQAYSFNLSGLLSVTGDNTYDGSGVTWSVVSSTLPAGLYLTADGYIGGTPTAAGSGSITARATYRGVNGQQAYSVITLDIAVGLAAATPPQAVVGRAYTYDLKPLVSVTGDASYLGDGTGVTWSLTEGSLPAGLSLNGDGTITGTPTAAGTNNIKVTATYRGVTGQQSYQTVALALTVSVNYADNPQLFSLSYGGITFDLSKELSVSGDPSFDASTATWRVVSGSLPAGLSLNANGKISGTPTALNTAGAAVTVEANYKGVTAQQSYRLKVGRSPLAATVGTIGDTFGCAITTAGAVKCWGSNSSGQLGNGTTTASNTPVQVSGLTSGVTKLVVSGTVACALTNVGAVKCWGINGAGQLGNNSTVTSSTPVQTIASGATSLSMNGGTGCAVVAGAAKCWGSNSNGKIGDNTTTHRVVPTQVSGLTSGIKSVHVGSYHACALTTLGAVYCWGANSYGQLGNGSTATQVLTPVAVPGLTGVTHMALGDNHTCALVSGAVTCWGRGNYGKFGNGGANSLVPITVPGVTAASIASTDNTIYAVTAGGAAYAIGYNSHYGQAGVGYQYNDPTSFTPIYGLSSGVSAIYTATINSGACAAMTDNTVRCWGSDLSGKQGDTDVNPGQLNVIYPQTLMQ